MTAQIGDWLLYNGEWVTLFTNPLEAWFRDGRPRPRSIRLGQGLSTADWRGYIAAWTIEEEKLYLLSISDPDGVPSDAMELMFDREGAPRALCLECGLPWRDEDLDIDRCPKWGRLFERLSCGNCELHRLLPPAGSCCNRCGALQPEESGGVPQKLAIDPSTASGLQSLYDQFHDIVRSQSRKPKKDSAVTPVFASWFSGILRIPDGELLIHGELGYDSWYERDILVQVDEGHVIGTQMRENRTPELEMKVEEERRKQEEFTRWTIAEEKIRQQSVKEDAADDTPEP